jgi:CDP-glycerol glycerophosphotransferase (TagB/SpsB family)/GT2 family glycosyltransferase
VRRFSIVLPVYNVRAYLRECLDSIVTQDFDDFEVIAVDDASPDHSGAILDEYAERDGRVRVLHLPENVGLGLAREAGMREASGEYVLFVDSDDYLAPGALRAVSARIDETDRPDIVVFDYARRYWYRNVVRNKLSRLFAAPGPDVFRIDDRPALLDLLPVVWNKAYRRDFVEAAELRFYPGYYEDTAWTYPAMLVAERITLLDRVCVNYRMRRAAGNILKSRSRKHFDIFDQWDHVWAYLDRRPELARWREVLMRRELEHLTTIIDRPRRLPANARREFFERAHRQHTDHQPTGKVSRPSGGKGLKMALVIRGSYPVFRFVQLALALVGRLRRAAGSTYRFGRLNAGRAWRLFLRFGYYRFQLLLPMNRNLAVYSAYWNRSVSCNPYAIYLKARELAPHVRGVWVLRTPETTYIPEGVEYVRPDTPAYFRALARARWLVNNVNFPDFTRKRRGSIHLQTQHGTPLKTMGLGLLEFPVGAADLDFPALLRRIDRWDFNISMNAFSTEVWERSYPAAFETLEVGYPRNDRLVRATAEEKAAIRERLGLAPTARVVLYAPTFRDYRRTFVPELDLDALLDAIGDDGVLLMRVHYFNDTERLDALGGREPSARMLDVSSYHSIEDLCIASDALITDYSSTMFDYANLDRPIALYAYDWDTYRRTRGVNFDVVAEPPGYVALTEEELLRGFRSGEVWGDAAAKARAQFRERFCHFDDGNASERVVRRVFLGEALPASMELDSTSVAAAPSDDGSSESEPPDNARREV